MLKPLEYIFSKTDFDLKVFIIDRFVARCSETSTLEFQHRRFIYSCSIDVITDALSKSFRIVFHLARLNYNSHHDSHVIAVES